MNRKITALLLCACCILCLAGCADVPDEHAQTEQTP